MNPTRADAGVMMHSKGMIVDEVLPRVGSSNLNNRSMGVDSECDRAIEAQSAQERSVIWRVRDTLLSRQIHGVEINPRLVATIQRLPQRTIELILPAPGTVSPRVAFQTPVGPSKTAVERFTSRTDQPSIVVGLVSGTGVRGISMRSVVVVSPGDFFLGERTEVSDRALSLFGKTAILLMGAGAALSVKLGGTLTISFRSDLARLEIELRGVTCISGTGAGLPSKKFNIDPAINPRHARGNSAAAITAVRKCLVSTFDEKEPKIRSSISI